MSNSIQLPSTPPSTTLSTPSPTELHDQDPVTAEAERMNISNAARKHIYLIVATTPVSTSSGSRLGIGLKGKLPWPMIRGDMNYFKAVTRDGSSTGQLHGLAPENTARVSNVVVMGRKTWSSIPPSFRPLGHRTNIVVTRSTASGVAADIARDLENQKKVVDSMEGERRADLLRKAKEDPSGVAAQRLELCKAERFDVIEARSSAVVRSAPMGKIPGVIVESNLEEAVMSYIESDDPAEVYCIGGAEIYGALLRCESLRSRLRILQTEILKLDGSQFECDTFWPEDLTLESSPWSEAETRSVEQWTGIETPQGTLKDWAHDEKVGVKIRVRGWELLQQ